MKEQERIEKALKDIHVLFAKSESLPEDKDKIVVDKRQLFGMLEEINKCMYAMMDRYEITKESRERSERKSKEKCEQMMDESTRIAEEIYAAAVMYTDDTMKELYEEIRATQTKVVEMTEKLADEIDRQLRTVVKNREELRGELTEMAEGEKYLRILQEESKKSGRDNKKAVEASKGRVNPSNYHSFLEEPEWEEPVRIMAPAPEIKIDPAYAEDAVLDEFEEGVVTPSEPVIQVNYDSAYFKMKQASMGLSDEDFEEGVIDPEDTENKAKEESNEELSEEDAKLASIEKAIIGVAMEEVKEMEEDEELNITEIHEDDGPAVFLKKRS